MESVGVGGVVQPGQLVVQQVAVLQRGIDKRRAQGVLAIQIRLINHLIRLAAGGRIGHHGRIIVSRHAVKGDCPRTFNVQTAAGINGDVVVVQARRVHFQGAAVAPVIARRARSAVTQVDAHAVCQGQLSGAGTQHHHRPVR